MERIDVGESPKLTVTNSAGNGTLLSPTTSPAITTYLASFIPIHIFTPNVNPSGDGTVTSSPPPSSIIIGSATSTPYYADRQLVTITANPNSGFNFYIWFNVNLFNLYANPYTLPIQSEWNSANAGLVLGPVTTITAASPDLASPPFNTFPGFAIGIVETSNGNALTTAFTPRNLDASFDGAGFGGAQLTLCGSFLSGSSCPGTPVAQSPVTTNISYLFNNWSGGQSSSNDGINITVPGSGHTTYTANYTPSFRSIVLASTSCGGNTVSSSPIGTNSIGNGFVDAFFNIGTVTFNATAGSGMSFFGWSQDLSGTNASLAFPLMNQIIGTANFNSSLANAALAITSLSPATATVTNGAADITINGTGLVAPSSGQQTFTYIAVDGQNFQFRSNTVNSSTQLVMHLQAGDLAAAGYYEFIVLTLGTPSETYVIPKRLELFRWRIQSALRCCRSARCTPATSARDKWARSTPSW